MPKKKKRKKKKNGEPKVNLEKDIEELQAKIDGLVQEKQEVDKKKYTINTSKEACRDRKRDLDRKLFEQIESYEEEIAEGVDEFDAQYHTDQQSINDLRQKNRELRVALAGTDILARENDTLRNRIVELDKTLRRQTKFFDSELAMRHKERFNNRLSMERTFRETLRDAKNSLEADAKAEIERESKEAKINNIYLKIHLNKESKFIHKRCHQYDGSSDDLLNLRIHTDLSESRNGMQSQKIMHLEENNTKYKNQIRSFQADLHQKQEQERNLLKQLDQMNAENARIEDENTAADAVIEKLMSQVAGLSSKTRSPHARHAHKKYQSVMAKGPDSTRKTMSQELPSRKQSATKTSVGNPSKTPLEMPPVDYEQMWNSAARGQQDAMIFWKRDWM